MKHQGWIMAICAVILLGAAALCFRLNAPQTDVTSIVYLPDTEKSEIAEQETEQPDRAKTGSSGSKKKPEEPDAEDSAGEPEREPIYDLNAAEKEDLMRVEGIGEVLADAILAYRTERGGFTRRAELTEIYGIGEILSARIMEEFYIPDELPPAETMPAKTEIPTPDDVPKPEPEDVPEPAAEEPPEESAEDDRPELLFDLNAVTYEQLMLLPDMRPEWAEGIITVREKLEGYFSLEELGLVDGLPDVYAGTVLREHLYLDKPEQ